MGFSGIACIALIIVNLIFSYRGLTNEVFFDGYKFEVDKILISKDYKRLFTSGFLHLSWTHLLFNMLSLYMFSLVLELQLGELKFLLIYFAGMLGGDLLALFIHRHHGDYSMAGASGAVCGIVFASIALLPGISLGFPGIPIHIPGWLYGLGYVIYTIYGIRSKSGNIGHEAHLGGALVGMATAIAMEPSALRTNYFPILIIAVPSLVFIYIVATRPHVLITGNFSGRAEKKYYSIDEKYNSERAERQKEIDRILDKIAENGMESLSKSEKQMLDEYSKTMQKK